MPKRKAELLAGEESYPDGEGITAPLVVDLGRVPAEPVQLSPTEEGTGMGVVTSQPVEGEVDKATEVDSGANLFWALLAQA